MNLISQVILFIVQTKSHGTYAVMERVIEITVIFHINHPD